MLFLALFSSGPWAHGEPRHVFADEVRRWTLGLGCRRRGRLARRRGPVKKLRGALGTQLDPNTAWMIMRSMETLSLRMHKSAENAALVANFLRGHPKVANVNYLGFLSADDPRYPVFQRQCESAGSTFGFAVKGGEAEAFRLLDALQVIKLAVSLGGTETLMSHPASTTHSGVNKQTRDRIGITDALIRISVGIEDAGDLIADLGAALDAV